MSSYADTPLLFFLFGIFCALWAQNTRRNPWIWFSFGWFVPPITGIVLLIKNNRDLERARQKSGAE